MKTQADSERASHRPMVESHHVGASLGDEKKKGGNRYPLISEDKSDFSLRKRIGLEIGKYLSNFQLIQFFPDYAQKVLSVCLAAIGECEERQGVNMKKIG